jgi:hypothetical protein
VPVGIIPSERLSQTRGGRRTLCADLSAQRVLVHEVRESALAVDLDDWDQLAVASLELGVAGDVDLRQVEAVLAADAANDCERALAEVAVPRVVDDDAVQRYG